jgi:hypothetical protein
MRTAGSTGSGALSRNESAGVAVRAAAVVDWPDADVAPTAKTHVKTHVMSERTEIRIELLVKGEKFTGRYHVPVTEM